MPTSRSQSPTRFVQIGSASVQAVMGDRVQVHGGRAAGDESQRAGRDFFPRTAGTGRHPVERQYAAGQMTWTWGDPRNGMAFSDVLTNERKPTPGAPGTSTSRTSTAIALVRSEGRDSFSVCAPCAGAFRGLPSEQHPRSRTQTGQTLMAPSRSALDSSRHRTDRLRPGSLSRLSFIDKLTNRARAGCGEAAAGDQDRSSSWADMLPSARAKTLHGRARTDQKAEHEREQPMKQHVAPGPRDHPGASPGSAWHCWHLWPQAAATLRSARPGPGCSHSDCAPFGRRAPPRSERGTRDAETRTPSRGSGL